MKEKLKALTIILLVATIFAIPVVTGILISKSVANTEVKFEYRPTRGKGGSFRLPAGRNYSDAELAEKFYYLLLQRKLHWKLENKTN